jgi:hypothetical protein
VKQLQHYIDNSEALLLPSLKILSRLAANSVGQNVILYTDYYKVVQSKPNSRVNLGAVFASLVQRASSHKLDLPLARLVLYLLRLVSNLTKDAKNDKILSDKRQNVFLSSSGRGSNYRQRH